MTARPFIVMSVGRDVFTVLKSTRYQKVIANDFLFNHVLTVQNGVLPPKSAKLTLIIHYVMNVRI